MFYKLVVLPILLLGAMLASGQTTFGTILGVVKDAAGGVLQNAEVRITNIDEGTSRTLRSDASGNYEAVNSKPGRYKVEISEPQFAVQTIDDLTLLARQTLRVDVTLQTGAQREVVNVESAAGVIATDTAAISSSYDANKILNLPANYRANGSTSPYSLIGTLPGVQSDSNNNFSLQGGQPSQSETTVDGISTQDVTQNAPLRNAFPSAESVAEVRVDAVGNAAEYGQPGEVTTVSKSGTNQVHGALFWYHQNRAFDAKAYGSQTQPQKIGNDFGGSVGGPVMIPHLYNGHDKTFFFGTYEGFQFPSGKTIQNSVPTQAMRSGDFSAIGTILDPTTNQQFPNNIIPASRISPVSQKFLPFFPLPNNGDTISSDNYITNRSANYDSNQFDVRLDHYLTSRMSVFGRFTWKNINQDSPQDLLVPDSQQPEQDRILVLSHNYTITPNLVNEFRFGFDLTENDTTNPVNGAAFTNSLGLTGIGPSFPFNGLPYIGFASLTSLDAGRLSTTYQSRSFQYNDNLSWTHGRHTMKFGGDIRRVQAVTPLDFGGADNYGTFNFNGTFTGQEFGDFLLGLPQTSSLDDVRGDNNGISDHYAVFAQDSFRLSARLTLEMGLRYEYQPAFSSQTGNIGNFDPSVPRSGRVIYPNGTQGLLAQNFLQSFNACPGPDLNGAPCTPVLSAQQAGIPNALRYAPKDRFLPRFGFAYRPFADSSTVVRGGFGIYNITTLGSSFYSLTGTLQSNVQQYNNVSATGAPLFAFPNTSANNGAVAGVLGQAYFNSAVQLHWKDPYSMQWNFSVDRNLGGHTGLRLSYIGMRTNDLVWQPDLNQASYSTQYFSARPLSDRPFPNWASVYTRSTSAIANYHSFQAEAVRRLSSGLTFDGTYTFARNLSDNQGPNPTAFAAENGGGQAEDAYDRRSEYGNVYGTRKHRFITTALYDLPFGHGRQFGASTNRIVDAFFGGWQLSSIFLWQSGPYLTPYFYGGDPSGTGSGTLGGRAQHPDRIANGVPQNQNRNDWINPNAFVCPGTLQIAGQGCTVGVNPGTDPAPIGRFGNSGEGILEGPGTVNLSTGLSKYFSITERIRLRAEGSFTNVLNHTNLADPNLNINNPSFGQITSARLSDFGGFRTGQVALRLEF